MFTLNQYNEAIRRLEDGKTQLEPDGRNCAVCGDSDHQAFECHFNPLVAMEWCAEMSEMSDDLHEHLHRLIGGVAPWDRGIFAALPAADDGGESCT